MTLAVLPRQTVRKRGFSSGLAHRGPSLSTETGKHVYELTGNETLVGVGTGSAVHDTLVGGSETTRLEHLALVLNQDCMDRTILRVSTDSTRHRESQLVVSRKATSEAEG